MNSHTCLCTSHKMLFNLFLKKCILIGLSGCDLWDNSLQKAACLWVEGNRKHNTLGVGRQEIINKWAGWLLHDREWCRAVRALATLQVTEVRRETVLLQVLLNTEKYPHKWRNAIQKKQETRQCCIIKYCPGIWDRIKRNESYQKGPIQIIIWQTDRTATQY